MGVMTRRATFTIAAIALFCSAAVAATKPPVRHSAHVAIRAIIRNSLDCDGISSGICVGSWGNGSMWSLDEVIDLL
jgi:hypothetical protein